VVSSCLSDFHHLFAFSFSINYSQRFCQSPGERGKLSDPLLFVFLLSTGHCLTINGTSCLTLPKRFKSTERFTLPPSLSCILYPSLSPWTECPRHLVNEGRAWGMHGILAVLPLPMTAQIVGLLFFCRSISIFLPAFYSSSSWNDRNLSGNSSFCLAFVWRRHSPAHPSASQPVPTELFCLPWLECQRVLKTAGLYGRKKGGPNTGNINSRV